MTSLPYNSTRKVVNAAIDRLEERLEDAREMPPWAIAFVVMVSVVVVCCLIQAAVFIVFGPIVLAYGRWRKGANQRLLSTDGEADNLGDIEISAAGDIDDEPPRQTPKRNGKAKVNLRPKSGSTSRHATHSGTDAFSRDNLHDMEL